MILTISTNYTILFNLIHIANGEPPSIMSVSNPMKSVVDSTIIREVNNP